MKYLFLNSARNWGGNEKWTYMAATSLARDHDVVFAYRGDAIGDRFNMTKYKLPFLAGFDLYTLARIISIVKKHNIDVLIPTKRKEYKLAGMAARFTGKINVLRLGSVRPLYNSPLYNIVYNKLADGIIVNAHAIKDTLLQSGFMKSEKIRVIHNGMDTEQLNAVKAGHHTMNKPFPFVVSSMGRITVRKGMDLLLKGFHTFIQKHGSDDAGLVLIGGGNELDYFREMSRSLDIENKVVFTGFLENPYPYLVKSDVFVLMSKREGLSNALLEAMYLGNAVVTTATGDSSELIDHGQNGFLVAHDDSSSLASILRELYTDRDFRNRIAKQAGHTVNEKYSLERMTSGIEEFCKELAGKYNEKF